MKHNTEANGFCQYLDWDSEFFGRRIARVIVNQLNLETIEHIVTWCNAHHIECLYFLGDAADHYTARLAEDNQFHLVDIRVTLEKQISTFSLLEEDAFQGVIRPCVIDDIPTLRAIASVSYRDSRFYHDPQIPESLSNALYETWIEKSCRGHADVVLVAELQDQPVGYISCHLLGQTQGQIGLVGVGGAWQGMGWGKRLVNKALKWFAQQNVTQVTIVTQGRNVKAQRLYQKCGFLTNSVQLWYHRWFLTTETATTIKKGL